MGHQNAPDVYRVVHQFHERSQLKTWFRTGRSKLHRGADCEGCPVCHLTANGKRISVDVLEVGAGEEGIALGIVDHLRMAAEVNTPAVQFRELLQGYRVGAARRESLVVVAGDAGGVKEVAVCLG